MPQYNRLWNLDSGREELWSPPLWQGVIEIASKYDGQNVYTPNAPIYKDLESAFPNFPWEGRRSEFRPVFRDYLNPWKYTKTLERDNHIIRLTPLAKELLAGQTTEADIFFQMFLDYEENGEKPFPILAQAFLEAKKPFSIKDVYFGVMLGFRPGDDLEIALAEAKLEETTPISDTPRRRLRFLLRLLERMGAISKWDDVWTAWNIQLLQKIANVPAITPITGTSDLAQMLATVNKSMALSNLHYDSELIHRYCASLLAKRFVILTGLSGSGKTKLAQAFASWITSLKGQCTIIPVGADWTSNEHVLGYADALAPTKYVRTPALDLILQAKQMPDSPFFLILDEMNLSHVERYFADMLSAIESGEEIPLYSGASREGVPDRLTLPPNLFIIGTVNVDETTYMFSPKVLDRANTIEFRVAPQDMGHFLNDPEAVNLKMLNNSGLSFAEAFVAEAKENAILEIEDKQQLEAELMLFFNVLRHGRAEFGYRTAFEITRFIFFHKKLAPSAWQFKSAMDAQILQKMLPRLQGSRKKLEPILWALATLCYQEHHCSSQGKLITSDDKDLQEEVNKALALRPEQNPFRKDGQGNNIYPEEKAYYPLSYNKILRMLHLLEQGFTSFAEA